jgi:hypothetical protein
MVIGTVVEEVVVVTAVLVVAGDVVTGSPSDELHAAAVTARKTAMVTDRCVLTGFAPMHSIRLL